MKCKQYDKTSNSKQALYEHIKLNGETSLDPANYVLVDGDHITVLFQ